MTLAEVFAMADQNDAATALRGAVIDRITAIGQAEVARRVAPLWGWAPRDAEARISRWCKGSKDMSSAAFLALLVALDLDVTPRRR